LLRHREHRHRTIFTVVEGETLVDELIRVTQRITVQANVDVYNVMNASGIQQVTSTFGPRWLLPQNVVEPRVVQFSGRVGF